MMHLTPAEFVDALEGTLSLARQSHVDRCGQCRAQVTSVGSVVVDLAGGGAVPEPSPLFWEHFSNHVARATRDIPTARPFQWLRGWRPLSAAVGMMVAAALLVLVSRPNVLHEAATSHAALVASADASGALTPLADDESLNFVANLASNLPAEDLQQAAQPTSDATDAMVEQLTPAQRAELARLLDESMKAGE